MAPRVGAQAVQLHPLSATLPRMPRVTLQGGLCRIGRRMIIVGHARCQVIEGSEVEYPSAVTWCEQRMEPELPQAVVACLVKDRLQPRGTVMPQAEV